MNLWKRMRALFRTSPQDITERESITRIAMLTKQRDAMITNRAKRDTVAAIVRWELRPGVQNGMRGLEEMEASACRE